MECNLRLLREVNLKKQKYRQSFDRIKDFVEIKKIGKFHLVKIKESFVEGDNQYTDKIIADNTSIEEVRVLRRFLRKEIENFAPNHELECFRCEGGIRIHILFNMEGLNGN